ncbi:uncharacterized protein LOC129808555 [Phlebotomus papatasi]|uniref:uncharacterized protein LOC129808555 n=1 Tax=Phlebotomus papatasi TaxID=29031 RepID=UPI0024838A89|nr:uncharacterized protein LOC129808555 [Phlebotomus papatasi]
MGTICHRTTPLDSPTALSKSSTPSPPEWEKWIGGRGAIRTAPTAALEVILGLPPLPLYIKAEAGMTAFGLRSAGTWKVGCHPVGHMSIIDSLICRYPNLLMRDDFQLRKRLPQRNFKPILHSRAEWRESAGEIIEPGMIALFTDGSRVEGSSGAGYYCPELGLSGSMPLGRNTTVFQAEITAILIGIRSLIETDIPDKQISIFSDSRTALLSISGYNSRSSLVLECREMIEMVSHNREVFLHWVPGHCGIAGNEEADRLAVAGAKTGFIGPEPAVGISPQMWKTIIKEDLLSQHQTVWAGTENCRVSKLFMPSVDSKRSEYLVGSNRCKARQFAILLTGHCLNKHLNRLGIQCNTICRGCNSTEETVLHDVCDCPSLYNTRRALLGKAVLAWEELPKLKPARVMEFIRKTGWLGCRRRAGRDEKHVDSGDGEAAAGGGAGSGSGTGRRMY